MARDENMIAALKRERATYIARGLDDRVAQVDDQLKHYGHNPATDDTADEKAAPKGRQTQQAAEQTTAEGGAGRQDTKPSTAAKPSAQTAADKRAGGKA
jgi:hypothetical protein